MRWQDRAFLGVTGAGTVLSVAHYLASARHLTAKVPIHFDLFGQPDFFAAPWAFVLYPILGVALGVAAAGSTLNPSVAAALPPQSVEQLATRVALLCSYVALLTCQVCATRMTEGSASKLPPLALGVLYGGLAAAVSAAMWDKFAR